MIGLVEFYKANAGILLKAFKDMGFKVCEGWGGVKVSKTWDSRGGGAGGIEVGGGGRQSGGEGGA